jgi:hypothetical protein
MWETYDYFSGRRYQLFDEPSAVDPYYMEAPVIRFGIPVIFEMHYGGFPVFLRIKIFHPIETLQPFEGLEGKFRSVAVDCCNL